MGIPVETLPVKRLNPKRAQRKIRRELAQSGITSKSHEAMRLQIEQNKTLKIQHHREIREIEREHKCTVARAKARHHER